MSPKKEDVKEEFIFESYEDELPEDLKFLIEFYCQIPANNKKVILIDPHPEILNEIKFERSLLNPKRFSFFWNLARLKL